MSELEPTRPASLQPFRPSALILGVMMSLVLYGYQVGKSNHTVYLLDAYRRLDPQLLANDWFTNSTLQYHGVFSLLTRKCLEWGIFEPVFLAGYLLTVIGFHVYAYRIVRLLGGSAGAYVLSIVLLHMSAGGTGLGGFQFLQDAAFLPSNVANVAMLAGIAMLMQLRPWAAAIWLGVAGIFHINHAVFAPFVLVAGLIAQPGHADGRKKWADWRGVLAPAVLLAIMVGANVLPALLHLRSEVATAKNVLPFAEFVQIYARLRHPHHYYPPAWPWPIYLACLWTLLPAAAFLWVAREKLPVAARHVVYAVSAMLLVATLVAFAFAGATFLSERLIQMAVFRFSIYYIYLACAITAWGIVDSGLLSTRVKRGTLFVIPAALFAVLLVAWLMPVGTLPHDFSHDHTGPLAATLALMGLAVAYASFDSFRARLFTSLASLTPLLAWSSTCGLNYIPADPPAYTRLAVWARDNTPKDALFLVPPNEQSWRLDALRAIVINFKAIPQTAAEMPEWKQRMEDVTGVQNLPSLAGTFGTTLQKIGAAYEARSPTDLIAVARKYNCRYIVTTQTLPNLTPAAPIDTSPFKLYDLDAPPPPSPPQAIPSKSPSSRPNSPN